MRRALVLCLAIANSVAGFAQGARGPASASNKTVLDQKVPGWLKENDVPSAAVAYIEGGKVSWTAVYGEQSSGVPATPKTLYNIASLTKPISAEIILRLASAGKLSLDEPLSPYWVDPDVKADPRNQLLTARLCLSHQAGFTNWRYQTDNVLKFQWVPGTQTRYSGEGYDYVSRFAQAKAGQPFEELAQKYVFDSIGMKDTAYMPRDWFAGRLAVARGPKGDVEEHPRTRWTAADLVRTTIDDYARFMVAVMHNQGLSKEVAAQRLTITRDTATPEEKAKLCSLAGIADCKIRIGMGLGVADHRYRQRADRQSWRLRHRRPYLCLLRAPVPGWSCHIYHGRKWLQGDSADR